MNGGGGSAAAPRTAKLHRYEARAFRIKAQENRLGLSTVR